MTLQIRCTTAFDITFTGVKNRFNKSRIPFTDEASQTIRDDDNWNRSRNQQSNWETITQVISLRTLPENISKTIYDSNTRCWSFDFTVIDPTSVATNENPLGLLLSDCIGVPMIIDLDEKLTATPMLIPESNIWFEVVNNE
jgi:hypothetical protein